MTKEKSSNKKIAFYVALFYVISATIYIYWTMNNLETEGIFFYFFFPVTIFPSLILLTEKGPLLMMFVCQTIAFLIIWPILFLVIQLFRDDNSMKDI